MVRAERKPDWEQLETSKGLGIKLDERKGVHWKMDPKTGNTVRSRTRNSEREIEMCARCHARRTPISQGYVHGERLLDHYLPRLLDEGMYQADGQIDEEVYVYGSFLQSRMYQAGVTCSDCHEPHSLQLRMPANGVWLQCHSADKYDATSDQPNKTIPVSESGVSAIKPPSAVVAAAAASGPFVAGSRGGFSGGGKLGTSTSVISTAAGKPCEYQVYPGHAGSFGFIDNQDLHMGIHRAAERGARRDASG